MRTTLKIADGVLRTVQGEAGAYTKAQAIHDALKEYIRRKKIERLIQLQGQVRFSSGPKTLRKGWEHDHHGSR